MREIAAFGAAAFAAGALGALGQAPWSSPIAALASIAGVVGLALFRSGVARAAWIGWAAGAGYFAASLSWIGAAFLVDPERDAWLQPFALILMPSGLALFWAGAFAGASALIDRLDCRGSPGRAATVFACVWTAAEFGRGHVLTGFPWGLAGYAWVDSPAAQTAAWIGPYGLTFVTMLIGAAMSAAAAHGSRRQSRAAAASVALACFGAAALWGAGAARDVERVGDGAPIVVRIVQPNVAQHEKWDPELAPRNLGWLLELTARPTDVEIDLVVWPEAATPYLIDQEHAFRAQIMTHMPGLAQLALGAFRYDRPEDAGAFGDVGERAFNSFMLLGVGGGIDAVYDKHRLVPFGEFLPLQNWLEALGLQQLAGGRGAFEAGPGPQAIALTDGRIIAPLICYEAIFPSAVRGDVRPDLFVQVTNDAWFGDSAGPLQHLVQARFRAIEQGVSLVRSANTGVSAAIDPFGRVLAAAPIGARDALDVAAPAALAPTIYARFGDGPAIAFFVAVMTLLFAFRR